MTTIRRSMTGEWIVERDGLHIVWKYNHRMTALNAELMGDGNARIYDDTLDGTRTHHVKIDGVWMQMVESGLKTVEIRYNDRDYEIGDWLVMHHIDEDGDHIVQRVIGAVLTAKYVDGLKEGYVALVLGGAK
ncbi:hypothetical protein AUQ37_03950 [Candidatus Methanomethylophilus sp. 1R26]|uniref:DUF3850 domain-containing protein n=1 Tax=Candidatus Methanomethylophilus sp. 1R26 TaxID=1769296 RepID=UPI000736D779|nr:DUF3850 domain-containing protein [Candidatus Methanomethylophilus sp. 1R26]KUE73023.1 hypothetical protein AUQ37_03950 [Candidatus Methanomethylophilus sp. 1R26]